MNVNVDNLLKVIDEIANRGLPYAIGLFTYILSVANEPNKDKPFINTFDTLVEAFGADTAGHVLNNIKREMLRIGWSEEVRVLLYKQQLASYIYDKYISPVIEEEISRRLKSAYTEDLEALSAISTVIERSRERKVEGVYIEDDSTLKNIAIAMVIRWSDDDVLSRTVSNILGRVVTDVRRLLYRYLLGIQMDYETERYYYYRVGIFSHAAKVVETFKVGPERYIAAKKWLEIARQRGVKDILEVIVAEALERLDFTVKVDHMIGSLGGQVEVDVWGERAFNGSKINVYVSCKNWSDPVDASEVHEEIGRVGQLLEKPHIKILVAPKFKDVAKLEALKSGFVVVEIGEKVGEENAQRAYEIVYEKLASLFTGVTPKRLKDITVRLQKAIDELKKVNEELTKLEHYSRQTYDASKTKS